MENQIKKIVLIGPESTGKSTLCNMLAEKYDGIVVPEFAREYLMQKGSQYNFDALLDIAKGQQELEEKLLFNSNKQIAFIDTDMYVIKVWCEFVFDNCHHWILNQITEMHCDLYLLCNTDIPWVKDELREYPDNTTRQRLYHHYKDIMINQQVPWVEISGGYEERFEKATVAIDRFLK